MEKRGISKNSGAYQVLSDQVDKCDIWLRTNGDHNISEFR